MAYHLKYITLWLISYEQFMLIWNILITKKSFSLGEMQWFLRFHGPPTRLRTVRAHMVSIGDGPWLSNKLSKVWRVHVWQNYNEKNWFWRPIFHRSYSVTQGVVKLLTRDFTTKDHPLLKPHSPWPAGVGSPRNPKSLNLP